MAVIVTQSSLNVMKTKLFLFSGDFTWIKASSWLPTNLSLHLPTWEDHRDSTPLSAEHLQPQESCLHHQRPHPPPKWTVHTSPFRPEVQKCEIQDHQAQELFFSPLPSGSITADNCTTNNLFTLDFFCTIQCIYIHYFSSVYLYFVYSIFYCI